MPVAPATSLRGKDLVGIDPLSAGEIQLLLDTAEQMREIDERPIKKVPALRGKTVVNLFLEPSTRPRFSFELAEKRLSADSLNFAASASSVEKGETLLDTARNLETMQPDFIVIRHRYAGAPHQLARILKASVINAGDGARYRSRDPHTGRDRGRRSRPAPDPRRVRRPGPFPRTRADAQGRLAARQPGLRQGRRDHLPGELPNTDPNTTTQTRLEEKLALAATRSLVNFGFYIGATPDNLEELQRAQRTPGIKIFIGSSTGDLLVDDQAALERIFAETTLPVAAHCEDETTVRANQQRYAGIDDVAVHSRIRDEQAACRATARAVDLARRHRHCFHVLHVSTGADPRHVRYWPNPGSASKNSCLCFAVADCHQYRTRPVTVLQAY